MTQPDKRSAFVCGGQPLYLAAAMGCSRVAAFGTPSFGGGLETNSFDDGVSLLETVLQRVPLEIKESRFTLEGARARHQPDPITSAKLCVSPEGSVQ